MGYGSRVPDQVGLTGDTVVDPHDLVKFGLIPEFVGRLPVVAVLENLTEEDLVHILTRPKNAMLKQYRKLMAMEGVDLTFTDTALAEIARVAHKRGTGARGLRAILERVMLDLMFEIPGQKNPRKSYRITKPMVTSRLASMHEEIEHRRIA